MTVRIKTTPPEDSEEEKRLFDEGEALVEQDETTLFGMKISLQTIHDIREDSRSDCASLLENLKERKKEKEKPLWKRLFQFA